MAMLGDGADGSGWRSGLVGRLAADRTMEAER
jgi:hypothetical protein